MKYEPDPTSPREPDANHSGEREFDALLGQARWPDLPPGAHERLRGTWRDTFGTSWSLRPWLVGIAAMLAVAVGTMLMLRHDPLRPAPQQAMKTRGAVHPIAATTIIVKQRSREPTPFERLLAGPPGRKPAAPAAQPPATNQAKSDAPAEAVAAAAVREQQRVRSLLTSGSRADVQQFLGLVLDAQTRQSTVRMLREMREDAPIRVLEGELDNGLIQQRYAAAYALGSVCNEQVVGRLCWMVQRNVHRREALAALLHCHEPAAARYLDAARSDPVIDAEVRSVQAQLKRIL